MVDTYALATQLLQLVVTELEALGVTLPSVQYVAPGGTVAYDGEQVSVNIGRWYGGQPGMAQEDFQQPTLHFHSADFIVSIVRETPVQQEDGQPPTVAAMEANAQLNYADGEALREALENIHRKYEWADRGIPVSIGAVTNYGPAGGVVGVYCTVSRMVG